MGKFKKVIIFILILLTIVLAGIAIYVGYRLKKERTAPKESEAAACPGNDNFNSVDECVSSCQYGCYQQTQYQQECLDGCYNACINICQGGTPNSCGNGTCDAPGETSANCPQDCGGGGGGTSCSSALQSCDSLNCCSGLVCQGEVGQRKCQDPTAGDTYQQCSQNATCGGSQGYIGFKCSGDFGTECHENPQTFNSWNDAVNYISGCGQVDEVWVGGSCNRELCGDFAIFRNNCSSNPPGGGGGPSPSCGDGNIDPSEQCDYHANPTGCSARQTCSTSCICEGGGGPSCGDGNIDPGEQCDYNANPTGCSAGQTCNTSCVCEGGGGPSCGNGVCDSGESCEVNGNLQCPSGNPLSSGLTCRSDCSYCGDGVLDSGEQCESGISCSTGSYCNESACSCAQITCDNLTRVGSDDVGPNEIEIFNVTLTAGHSEPYSQSLVRLRVSSTSNDDPVGRDPSHLSESLVVPLGVSSSTTSDPNIYNWTYAFAWQATNVDNSQLTNGDYDVEVSFDGGNTWQSSPCMATFTYNSSEEVEPAFLIIKSSSVSSCSTSAGADISYTITVTNLGPGAGVIDYVEDQLDPNVNSSWVANIGSSRGIVGQLSGNVIRWVGTVSQRSYDEDQSATFSYTLSIPASSLNTFIQQSGVNNTATVVYNPDQNRFSLVTPLECSTNTYGNLPSTGINDQMPILVALATILVGLVAYKIKFGQEPVQIVLSNGSSKFIDILSNLGFAPIIGEVRKEKLEKEFLDEDDNESN